MKVVFTKIVLKYTVLLFFSIITINSEAQVLEWRLVNPLFNAADPDGAGPATGSVTFTLQIHTVSGTVSNVNAISVGYSYQSTNAMLPTTITCPSTPNNPANIALSSTFSGAGFVYSTVNQCGVFVQSNGTHSFDRRTVGTLENGSINITDTWIDVFTVTLWSLNNTNPQAGYVIINSGFGGSPGAFNTYEVADDQATGYVVNSLTFTNALALVGGTPTPVLFTDYKVNCGDNGTLISWRTASEENSSHFVIEKNTNGSWKAVDQVVAAGNSSVDRDYRYIDLEGGIAQYRIKQVDKDGQFTYTAISYATCEDKKVKVFIYPVPARDVLNVAIRTEKALRTNLEVFDMSGRMVARQATVLNSGNNNITINVGHLASGEYVIRSSDGTIQLNKKFTIIH